jgi:hypothetical protein
LARKLSQMFGQHRCPALGDSATKHIVTFHT